MFSDFFWKLLNSKENVKHLWPSVARTSAGVTTRSCDQNNALLEVLYWPSKCYDNLLNVASHLSVLTFTYGTHMEGHRFHCYK